MVAQFEFQPDSLALPARNASAELGIEQDAAYAVEDLMYDEIYHWQGADNFVSLDPRSKPVHILKVLRS